MHYHLSFLPLLAMLVGASLSTRAQTVILSEGFETYGSTDFRSIWSAGDSNTGGPSGDATTYWWPCSTSFPTVGAHSGSWKCYCAGYRYSGSNQDPRYQYDMAAYMSRTVNLNGYSSAQLVFWLNIPSIESCCDYFRVKVGGTEIYRRGIPTSAWVAVTNDLSAYIGDSRTLTFEFVSDSAVQYVGAWLDDVTVTATRLEDLIVQVKDQNGVVTPSADVNRYTTAWSYLDDRTTAVDGKATWSQTSCGSYGIIVVRNSPWAAERWSKTTVGTGGLNVVPRTLPYVTALRFYNHSTSQLLQSTDSVPEGTVIRAEADVINKHSAPMNCKLRLIMDRDKATPRDLDAYSSSQSIPANNGTATLTLTYTANGTGTYHRALILSANYSLPTLQDWPTDSWDWNQVFSVVAPPPEIAVFGPGGYGVISDGDTTPIPNDGTDFGTINQGGSMADVEFVVRNEGGSSLTLGIVTVPTGFTLTESLSSSLAPGASDTFTVRLDNAVAGIKTGDVSFSNNDSNENPFNFSIIGRVDAAPPEVTVLGVGGYDIIIDGDTTPTPSDGTDFGTITQGGSSASAAFVVRNDGSSTLTLGAVSVPPGFTLTEGLSTSLAPGASDTFTVRLDNATAGIKAGDITFSNNDNDENPYHFRITGVVSPNLTWSPWVQIQNVPQADGATVDLQIKHDGSWRSTFGYGIPDLEAGHARAFGYEVAGTNFLATDVGRLQLQLISRVASALDAEGHRSSGSMLPYLSTTNGLFAFDIGPTHYSSIVEWQESSAHGRAFRWRTALDMLTGQPGQPHFGWLGEYHSASTRKGFYRDAIRTAIYQVDRSHNPTNWQFQFYQGATILKDSFAYLAVKEGIPAAKQATFAAAKEALLRLETLAVDISPAIPATEYVPIMQKLWAAQDLLDDSDVHPELVNYLGPDHVKALKLSAGGQNQPAKGESKPATFEVK